MAKISGLSLLGAAPADDDEFVILDVSDTTQGAGGSTKGLVATRVARTGAANTFTAQQTFAPSVGTSGITVNQPAAETSAAGITVANNNQIAMTFFAISGVTEIGASRRNLGNNVPGPSIYLGRNSNAGTNGPTAAAIRMEAASGVGIRSLWVDTTGVLRMHSLSPTGSSGVPGVADNAGSAVGDQTSWHGVKQNIAEWDGAEAFDAIRALTLYSYEMIDDSMIGPDGSKPVYHGLVITEDDRSNNAWFGQGYGEQQIPSLNNRNLFGYMLAAIRHGGNIINELQSQVAALTARVDALESV